MRTQTLVQLNTKTLKRQEITWEFRVLFEILQNLWLKFAILFTHRCPGRSPSAELAFVHRLNISMLTLVYSLLITPRTEMLVAGSRHQARLRKIYPNDNRARILTIADPWKSPRPRPTVQRPKLFLCSVSRRGPKSLTKNTPVTFNRTLTFPHSGKGGDIFWKRIGLARKVRCAIADWQWEDEVYKYDRETFCNFNFMNFNWLFQYFDIGNKSFN